MQTTSKFLTCLLTLMAVVLVGCERPPVDSTQLGYRGTGMIDVQNPREFHLAHVCPRVLHRHD